MTRYVTVRMTLFEALAYRWSAENLKDDIVAQLDGDEDVGLPNDQARAFLRAAGKFDEAVRKAQPRRPAEPETERRRRQA